MTEAALPDREKVHENFRGKLANRGSEERRERLRDALGEHEHNLLRVELDVLEEEAVNALVLLDKRDAQIEAMREDLQERQAKLDRKEGYLEACKEHREEQAQALERIRLEFCICDTNPETTDGPSEECPLHGREEFTPRALLKRVDELESQLDAYRRGTEITGEALKNATLLASVRLSLVLALRARLKDVSELADHRDYLIAELDLQNRLLRERIATYPGGDEFVHALITSMS